MEIQLVKIEKLLSVVNKNTNGIFSSIPEPIIILNKNLSEIIGDNIVYLSEFVIAKIKGKVPELNSHVEITDDIFLLLPTLLQSPQEILKDTRALDKYLFIICNPFIEVVIEVRRIESNKTEINTLHKINIEELKRLERKFPVVL